MTSELSTSSTDFDALPDEMLVAHIHAGHQQAFRALMQRYNQRLYRTARGIVADDAEAEDVVQESYMRAFAAIGGFRGDSGVFTWLTRIVINEARGRLRRRRNHVDLDEVEMAQKNGAAVLAFPSGKPMENPEVDAAHAQVRQLLQQAIDSLPEAFRVVFVLREIQDCSVEETAALLGIRPETVKTRLFRARRQLRDLLNTTLADVLMGSFPFLGHRCERLTMKVLARLAPQHGWINEPSPS